MMRPGGNLAFEYEWLPDGHPEDEPEIKLSVEATITDFHSAVLHLRNGDPGWPAEGGDVEELRVLTSHGQLLDPIPEALVEQLEQYAADMWSQQ